jgi:hypothetical protein
MKPLTFMLGSVLILAAGLWAQQTQVLVENNQIKIELTKYLEPCAVVVGGKGSSNSQDANLTCTELAITNKSRTPITAWVATTETDVPGAPHHPPAMGIRSSDSVPRDNPNDSQILPRDTHRVILGNKTRVDFKAAVFSDGSVFGDPEWVKRIIQNRRQIYQATAIALRKLRAAKEAGTPREQLVREFRELERQEREQDIRSRRALTGPPSLPLSRLGVYGTVAANLERSQAEGNADTLSRDIDHLESMMLEIGNQLLVSRPPISDHPVPLGEPLDSPLPPGHTGNRGPSSGIG